MKRIDLKNGYVVDVDERNFSLKSNVKNYTNDKGEELESSTVHGYFGQFDKVLEKLIKLKFIEKVNGVIDLKEMLKIVKETQAEIKEITSELKV